MADHGIMMTDPMMRSTLTGDKDVTRRISDRWARARVGDRLWFREVWAPCPDTPEWNGRKAFYRADGRPPYGGLSVDKWRSSMVMPRVVCRATGIITSIGQVRLQDIDEADALREGMGALTWDDVVALKGERKAVAAMKELTGGVAWRLQSAVIMFKTRTVVERFQLVFELLNPGQWAANPLVWRVEWRRE